MDVGVGRRGSSGRKACSLTCPPFSTVTELRAFPPDEGAVSERSTRRSLLGAVPMMVLRIGSRGGALLPPWLGTRAASNGPVLVRVRATALGDCVGARSGPATSRGVAIAIFGGPAGGAGRSTNESRTGCGTAFRASACSVTQTFGVN
jgi:hypothetical protein